METAIKIEHINKYFGKKQILKDVSFDVYRGEVFGFLGPNGAGKSTTIKMIVGLLCIDEGSISICGADVEKNFEDAMAHVGAIVENPETYKYMSGMDNLKIFARMRPGVTKERIDEVVEMVGLKNRINEKVGKYSLGMKQRLGLAQAMLHNPEVIILDEPTNGLDPAGIKSLRDILKFLAHEKNVCVIVSSHMMSEMELMCDRVGVIVNGQILAVKSIEDLIADASGTRLTYHIGVSDIQSAEKVLNDFDEKYDIRYKQLDTNHMEVSYLSDNGLPFAAEINKKLVMSDVMIHELMPIESKKLEDVFLEMTGEGGEQIA